MSAGGLILINGTKGMRYCLRMSTALIHQGSGGASGDYAVVMAQNENYKRLVNMMKDNILENTNITKAQLSKKGKSEWYIYADEQVELGMVDHIVEDIDEII